MFPEINRKEIKEALTNFQAGRPFETKYIRKEILDSWERCRGYGVDPQVTDGEVLSSQQVNKLQEDNKDLIAAADEYLRTLYDAISDYGTILILTDHEGTGIYVIGDEEILNEQQNKGLGLGSIGSEESIGTNGTGTALFLDRPIQICAEEHYCWTNHKWYCSGVPIHDSNGKAIGCLGISGTHEKVHAHTLGMAIGAAKSIERQLEINKYINERELIISQQRIILDMVLDGIIMLDASGRIKHANRKAIQMFDMANQEIIGTPINQLIVGGVNFDSFEKDRPKIKDKEIDITLQNKELSCLLTVEFIWDKLGGLESIILTFKERTRVLELVNKVAGSTATYTFEDIHGKSDSYKETIRQAAIAAKHDYNVLITGESGTGKELMVHAIHNASKRADKPFIAINCGALPRGLIESELFGYTGGAFTGSRKEGNPGKFELADGGTIFLDEIGEMPLDIQVTLLRVLQEHEVTRIGGTKSKKVDVKVIAATNRDLKEAVENQSFRQDLYYRLNVFHIALPPLRNRKEDIPLLTEHILSRLSRQVKKPELKIDDEVKEIILDYNWPGNIRELENVLERATFLCEGSTITKKELPIFDHEFDNKGEVVEVTEKGEDALDLELVIATLSMTKGNVKKAAEKLGVARSSIYRKLQKNGLSYNNFR